ncbi:MAG TPA: RNA polymerase sigma-70 factor [Vicinamibacterales bacterium]|nr:RNA polymerase sigma-70 factor [Vicinamibacterales bacterium]
MSTAADQFEALRNRLFGLAYRMLGSRADAEDVVQDAWLRWHRADQKEIRSAEAWLVTTTARLSIDRLRELRTQREAYKGPWLPEPMMAADPPPPDRHLDLAADLSVAFLVLLERLAPEERAAFLLHDVFDRDYDEIAAMLGKSESACRQIVHRARARVRSDRKRFEVTEAAKASLLRKFTAAVEAQDEQTLRRIFAPDATWTADGGGRAPAAQYPVKGGDRIAQLVLGIVTKTPGRVTFHLASVNGETGLCVRIDGRLRGVMSIDTDGDRIHAVYVQVNPDKLEGAPLPS